MLRELRNFLVLADLTDLTRFYGLRDLARWVTEFFRSFFFLISLSDHPGTIGF